MADKVYKSVVIGYGSMGPFHGNLFSKLPQFEFAGVYDIDPAVQEKAKAEGIKVFATEDEIYKLKPDLAVLAVPNELHLPYIKKLAKAGINIVCEKPATITAKEFEEAVAAAESAGVKLIVHQNRRWDADYLIAKKIADSGIIGKVYRFESRVTGGNGIPGGWRKLPECGGGMMLDWGVHLIDQMCCYNKTKIERMYCKYSYQLGFDVDDGFFASLDFADGVTADITVETNTLINLPRWMIYGTEGTAIIEDWALNGKILVKRDSSEKVKTIRAGNGFTKTMATRPDSSMEQFDIPAIETPANAFYNNVAATLAGKEEQTVKNSEVLRVLKIMEQAKFSAENDVIIKKSL